MTGSEFLGGSLEVGWHYWRQPGCWTTVDRELGVGGLEVA